MGPETSKYTDNVILLETSGQWLITGAFTEESSFTEALPAPREAFTRVFPMIKHAMEKSGMERPDWIVCSIGPGSFTGTRIGVLTARSLAQLWGIPVLGLSSIDAIAFCLHREGRLPAGAGPIGVMLDAKQKRVYARAIKDPGAPFQEQHAAVDIEPEEFLRELSVETPVFADDPETILSYIPQERTETVHPERILPLTPPSARGLLEYAYMLGGKDSAGEWSSLRPLYLRSDPATARYPQGFQRNTTNHSTGRTGKNSDHAKQDSYEKNSSI